MISLKIEPEDNVEFFERLLTAIGERLIELMQRELRNKDAIATGYLYRAFDLTVEGLTGLIENDAPYSRVLEYGCEPHTPPYDAILKWVYIKKEEVGEEARKAAWRIVKKIEKEGYEGRYYARDALEELVRHGRSL